MAVRFGCLPVGWSLLTGVIAGASALSPADQFAGHYVLIRDQSADLREAIDRATATMNFIVRPIARRQLRQKTVLCSSFSMEKTGGFLRITLAGEPALSLPLSGAAVPWRAPDGETVRVHLIPGPELVQVFEAKLGRRENHFTLSADRAVLTMSVKITSYELPQPVEYRLIYRRV
ncbi:MAG: hypothetical protein ACJ73N_07095 [Bryobacteraceae bacterium]